MKYYFPTTTLNFANILSSEVILPLRFYSGDSTGMWWNRFYSIVEGTDESSLCIYQSKFWPSMQPLEGDHYPMLVELDDSLMMDKKLHNISENTYLLFDSIELSSDTTRFIFRSEEERKTMLIKVSHTLENKSYNSYLSKNCFVVGTDIPEKSLDKVVVPGHSEEDDQEMYSRVLHQERLAGARLGWIIGKRFRLLVKRRMTKKSVENEYQQSIRQYRSQLKDYANGLDEEILERNGFESFVEKARRLRAKAQAANVAWNDERRKPLLSSVEYCGRMTLALERKESTEEHTIEHSIVDYFVRRKEEGWSWEWSSLQPLCIDFWKTVLKPFYDTGKNIETYRGMFNSFLENRQNSLEKSFRVADCADSPEIQAFTGLMLVGRDSGRLVQIMDNEDIRSPELLLAMYGAIVGYAKFPRTLLEVVEMGTELSATNDSAKNTVEYDPSRENPLNSSQKEMLLDGMGDRKAEEQDLSGMISTHECKNVVADPADKPSQEKDEIQLARTETKKREKKSSPKRASKETGGEGKESDRNSTTKSKSRKKTGKTDEGADVSEDKIASSSGMEKEPPVQQVLEL